MLQEGQQAGLKMALLDAEVSARGCAFPLELRVASGVDDDRHGRVRTRFDYADKVDGAHCRHRMGCAARCRRFDEDSDEKLFSQSAMIERESELSSTRSIRMRNHATLRVHLRLFDSMLRPVSSNDDIVVADLLLVRQRTYRAGHSP